VRAHATQIPLTSWLYSIAGNFGEEFMGVEYYSLAAGGRGPGGGARGWGRRPLARLGRGRARRAADPAPPAAGTAAAGGAPPRAPPPPPPPPPHPAPAPPPPAPEPLPDTLTKRAKDDPAATALPPPGGTAVVVFGSTPPPRWVEPALRIAGTIVGTLLGFVT